MERKYYDKFAADFAAVIMELSSKPENLSNLESYLSRHFAIWMDRHASTPEDLVEELQMFVRLKLGDD